MTPFNSDPHLNEGVIQTGNNSPTTLSRNNTFTDVSPSEAKTGLTTAQHVASKAGDLLLRTTKACLIGGVGLVAAVAALHLIPVLIPMGGCIIVSSLFMSKDDRALFAALGLGVALGPLSIAGITLYLMASCYFDFKLNSNLSPSSEIEMPPLSKESPSSAILKEQDRLREQAIEHQLEKDREQLDKKKTD